MKTPSCILALAAVANLSACATIETTGPGRGWKEGISYNLPKGMFQLIVVEDVGKLTVHLAGPVMVADPDFPLVSRLPRSGTSDNTVKVTVDPKTNLLNKVDVTSIGDLGTIVQNIAKVIALQAGTETSGSTVFSRGYDIAHLKTDAANDLNHFLVQYYATHCGSAERTNLPFAKTLKDDATVATDNKTLAMACRRMSLAGLPRADILGLITIAVAETSVSDGTASWSTARAINPVPDGAQCSTGLCYRAMRTVAITLEVRGAFIQGDVFLVPDETRTMFVSLPQGVFAEQKYNLVFTDGVLTDYGQTTKSELVGLTALPIDIIKAVLSAPGEALGLKTTDIKGKTDYLDQLAKLQTAKDKALEICKTNPNACPTTARKIIGGDIIAKAAAAAVTPPAPAPKPGEGFVTTDPLSNSN